MEEQLENLTRCQEACERCDEGWSSSKVDVARINRDVLGEKLEEKGRVEMGDILENKRRIPRSIVLGQDIKPEEYGYALASLRRKEQQGPTYRREEDKDVEGYAFNVERPTRRKPPPLKGE